MTPDEELAALRRLADLQAPAPPAPPERSLLDKGRDIADIAMQRIGRPLARGGLNMLEGIDTSLRNNAMFGAPYQALTGMAGMVPPNAESALPTPQNEDKAETYSRRMVEGAPSALTGGGGSLIKSLIPAMIGPAAGQAAGDFVRKIAPDWAGKADTAANTITQIATSLGLAHKSLPPEAEAAKDVGTLTNMGLNRIGPQKGGLEVANQTSAAANKVEAEAAKNTSDMFGAMVDGAKIRPAQAAGIYNYLRGEAARIEGSGVGQRGEAEALRKIADQFLRGDKQGFVTDVPSLSLQIKQFKLDPNQTGISENNLKAAIKTAETALGDISPEFARANKVFSYAKQNLERPLKEGTIGRLSDTNPYPADPTSPGRLNALVKDTSPKDIVSTMAALKSSGASPEDIARALVAKRVEGGGMMPGEKVFGGPGSAQEENISALLNFAKPPQQSALQATLATGTNPPKFAQAPITTAEHVRAPLNAADEIARTLAKGNQVSEYGVIGPGGFRVGLSVKPGAIKNFFAGNPSRDAVHALLDKATPEEIKQIQQLASFDPKIRLALTMAAIARPKLARDKE